MRRRIVSEEELDRPKVRRVILVMAAGTAIAGFAASISGQDFEEEQRIAAARRERPADPLRTELQRCGSLGEAALADPACRAAWAENRRRFFSPGERRPSQEPQP
jgi:conjugative transfer region protein TrbK